MRIDLYCRKSQSPGEQQLQDLQSGWPPHYLASSESDHLLMEQRLMQVLHIYILPI